MELDMLGKVVAAKILTGAEHALARAIGKQGYPLVSLERQPSPDKKILDSVSRGLCEKYCLVPLAHIDETLIIAIADPGCSVRYGTDLLTGFEGEWRITDTFVLVAEKAEILQAVRRFYGEKTEVSTPDIRVNEVASHPPIVEEEGIASLDPFRQTLLREKIVTPIQIAEADADIKMQGGRLGDHLVRLGYLEETKLVALFSRQYGVPSTDLSTAEIPEDVIRLIPKDVAGRHNLIPVNRQGNSLIVAMSDPSNIYAMDDIKFLTGFNIECVVTTEAQIKEALEKYYDDKTDDIDVPPEDDPTTSVPEPPSDDERDRHLPFHLHVDKR